MSTLFKTKGRSLVTETIIQSRQVWIPDPVQSVSPPSIPPIQSVTPEPPQVFVPFVGETILNCITSNGRQGYRLAIINADGTIRYLTPCTVSDGVGV